MGYIGVQPTSAPLTSSDITDGIISTAKIADGAVTSAKIPANAVTNSELNLGSDYAFTGTISGAGGGKVLQVKQATDQTQRTVNSTSYATWNNTLSVAITPTASSSKFLVSFDTEAYSALNAVSLYLTIFRNSTDIGNSSGYGLARHYVNASDVSMGMNGTIYDAPSTASEITYTVRAKLQGSGTAYFNSQTIGTLTVIEIGA